MPGSDVEQFRERANTVHRARVQSDAADRVVQRVEAQPRRGRFFRSKHRKARGGPPPAPSSGSGRAATAAAPAAAPVYKPAAYKATDLNLSNDMLLAAMSRVKGGESMDDVIAGLLEAGSDANKPTRAASAAAVTLRPPRPARPPRNQSSAASLAFEKRKSAIRARAATVQQRKSRAMTAAALGGGLSARPNAAKPRTSTASGGPRPPRPTKPPLYKPTIIEDGEDKEVDAATDPQEDAGAPPSAGLPRPAPVEGVVQPSVTAEPALTAKPTATKPPLPTKPTLTPKAKPSPVASTPPPPDAARPDNEPPATEQAIIPAPAPPDTVRQTELASKRAEVAKQHTASAPTPTVPLASAVPIAAAAAAPAEDTNAALPRREPPPKAKKLQGNKFAALAAMLDARVASASQATSAAQPSTPFPPLPPLPVPGVGGAGGPPPPPPPPLGAPDPKTSRPAAELDDLAGDRNAAAYIEDKRRKEQRAKAVKMLGVRALAERNRAASMARRDFENEMAAMAGRLRKRNDDRFAKKAQEVEQEEDEDVSPALAAALAKVRAEKKAKDEAALQKMRDMQVLAGDRSAAAFLEAKAEKAKAASAKKKLSMKEQAELDRQAEERRAAFEAEMKARSGNLKKQTTKVSAMSVKDMFAGADMSSVTKFADGQKEADEDDDSKPAFLKEIERSKTLKKTGDAVGADTELFVGVNETDGDPRGQHLLTVVRATGKAITVRWPPWEGDKVSYALLKDGEMMTATEPGESPAATVLPLEPKTTYRIKVVALGAEGIIGDDFAERNCSSSGVGQTWVNESATTEAAKVAPKPPPPAAPLPSVTISVLRSTAKSVTLVWQPFGGTTTAESKRKCFCVMMDDDVQIVTEQNDKTVAPITDIQSGVHTFRIIALNFDGSPAAESEPLTLEFDGAKPPVVPVENDGGEKSAAEAKPVDATQAPAPPVVVVISEVEPEFTWDGPDWAEEFAKMLKVGLPEEMVRMKMGIKGIAAADINGFFAERDGAGGADAAQSTEERVILQKLERRRQTLSKTESYAAWEAKKQRRQSTAVQRRHIREKIFDGATEDAPSTTNSNDKLSEAEAAFRTALSEELQGLAIECETLDGSDRAAFENRHISVILEKMEELPKMAPEAVNEEEYIEDLNELVDVADQLQLDESQFDSVAAEMDFIDENDISELAEEFDTIPEEERRALFG